MVEEDKSNSIEGIIEEGIDDERLSDEKEDDDDLFIPYYYTYIHNHQEHVKNPFGGNDVNHKTMILIKNKTEEKRCRIRVKEEKIHEIVSCVAISDTHNLHDFIVLPEKCDCLFHVGDFSNLGLFHEANSFNKYLGKYKSSIKERIVVSGNHEWMADALKSWLSNSTHYLLNERVDIFSSRLSVYGMRFKPGYKIWGANDNLAYENVDFLPQKINVLLTHRPLYRILDETIKKVNRGSKPLKKKVEEIQPDVVLFGHVHEYHGVEYFKTTHNKKEKIVTCINAASVICKKTKSLRYPIVFDLVIPRDVKKRTLEIE